MMTEQQKVRAATLKSTIAATVATSTGTPLEVREAAVELARDMVASGSTACELATVLGVHPTTLSRWKREMRPARVQAPRPVPDGAAAPRFREVRVEASTPRPRASTPPRPRPSASPLVAASSRALRVAHAPSGLVIDGLDVETLAALVRSLS